MKRGARHFEDERARQQRQSPEAEVGMLDGARAGLGPSLLQHKLARRASAREADRLQVGASMATASGIQRGAAPAHAAEEEPATANDEAAPDQDAAEIGHGEGGDHQRRDPEIVEAVRAELRVARGHLAAATARLGQGFGDAMHELMGLLELYVENNSGYKVETALLLTFVRVLTSMIAMIASGAQAGMVPVTVAAVRAAAASLQAAGPATAALRRAIELTETITRIVIEVMVTGVAAGAAGIGGALHGGREAVRAGQERGAQAIDAGKQGAAKAAEATTTMVFGAQQTFTVVASSGGDVLEASRRLVTDKITALENQRETLRQKGCGVAADALGKITHHARNLAGALSSISLCDALGAVLASVDRVVGVILAAGAIAAAVAAAAAPNLLAVAMALRAGADSEAAQGRALVDAATAVAAALSAAETANSGGAGEVAAAVTGAVNDAAGAASDGYDEVSSWFS